MCSYVLCKVRCTAGSFGSILPLAPSLVFSVSHKHLWPIGIQRWPVRDLWERSASFRTLYPCLAVVACLLRCQEMIPAWRGKPQSSAGEPTGMLRLGIVKTGVIILRLSQLCEEVENALHPGDKFKSTTRPFFPTKKRTEPRMKEFLVVVIGVTPRSQGLV